MLFQVAHPHSYTYKLTKIEEFENSFSFYENAYRTAW